MADNTTDDVTENWDDLNDDDFMAALDQAAGGEPVEEEEAKEVVNEDEIIEDTDPNTDPEQEIADEPEPEELIGDEAQESGEEAEEGTEEVDEANTQAENDSEQTDDSKDEAGSEETGNEEGDDADADQKAEEIDYKVEYAKLLKESAKHKEFFEKSTSEFVANGRKTKGFDDADKVIRSQQIAAGYSEKMGAFKPYKPFMNALKEKGMLESPEKFNLALQLLDGDPEALKKQIKDFNIDPFEMDMDNIDYVPQNQVSTDIEIALDDVMESANKNGVGDQVQKIIGTEWDDDSVIELLEDPQNSADLIDHLNSGAYNVIQDRIADKRRSDVNNVYGSKPMIQQYREAAIELIKEQGDVGETEAKAEAPQTTPEIDTNPEWISKDPKQDLKDKEYAEKVEKQTAETNKARRKATSLSKKKRGATKPKKQIDPLTLSDDEFTNYIDSIAYQK